MINLIARHKLSKLRNSRMLLVFMIIAAFILLFVMAPILFIAGMQGAKISAALIFGSYFGYISAIGHLAALLIGATCWRQDLRDGTILTFAAKPLSRFSLFFGKVLGGVYALLLYFVVALALYAVVDLFVFSYVPPSGFWIYAIQQFLSLIVTFSLVLFLSNFFNPVLAVVIFLVIFFIEGILGPLAQFDSGGWKILGIIVKAISVERSVSYSASAMLNADIDDLRPVWNAIGYFMVWIIALVSASALLFDRRQLLTKRS